MSEELFRDCNQRAKDLGLRRSVYIQQLIRLDVKRAREKKTAALKAEKPQTPPA